jgi:hypothetical protein
MKQETLEEAAYRLSAEKFEPKHIGFVLGVIEGAKWQAERMYNRQDLIDFVHFINDRHFNKFTINIDEVDLFIEQRNNKF